MSLRTWYDGLVTRAQAPTAAFGSGFAAGAGIPSSTEGVKSMISGVLGTMFGIPETYSAVGKGVGQTLEGVGQAAAHPSQTLAGLMNATRENPMGAAGFSMGMAAGGIDPTDLPKALTFGKKALTNAERRMSARVAAERARVHASLEGPTTSMKVGDTWIFPEGNAKGAIPVGRESQIEHLIGLPDKTLQRARSYTVQNLNDPEHLAKLDKELARRGLKPDISDELQLLHEGPVGTINELPGTRSAQALKPGGDYTWEKAPPIFTREERGKEMLENLNLSTSSSRTRQLQAEVLKKYGPQVPPGITTAFGGKRWLNTKKGWTYAGGKLEQKDYKWIFDQTFDIESPSIPEQALGGVMELPQGGQWREANIDRAIETVASAGGIAEHKARDIVAKHIQGRMKTGMATSQEIVWWNVWKSGGFLPGKTRWNR